jgi:hypothetical protein
LEFELVIPSQTSQILFGMVVALLYAGAVVTIGVLPLAVSIGRPASANVRARIGLFGFIWLGFVMGQGILGVIWLALALTGNLYSWLIWMGCALGWFLVGGMLLAFRRQAVQAIRLAWSSPLSFLHSRLWYSWLGVGIFIVVLLRGVIALLPPANDDALQWYLTVAKVISFSHTAELQPFVIPHSGLIQSLIEIHWAALFAISNETAVTVWDYLCALSFLCGLGFLSWSLTSSRWVALLAVLMMLSTPGFYDLIGCGKADNAATQYGMAAFLWLVLWPVLGRRSVILAGLCAGWAIASRFTNVIVLPALMVFTVMMVHRTWKAFAVDGAIKQLKSSWGTDALVGSIAVGFGVAPLLIKNWLLVGCPLAPLFGCRETFWAYRIPLQNISVIDLLFYPFVWTFAHRYKDNMLGNLSPLFLGFLPFLLAYRHLSIVRHALIAGFAGLTSITTWLLIEPLVLFTRWLLIPLGLLAVPLSASVAAVEQDLRRGHRVCWFVRSAIFIVFLFLLFQSRSVVYGIRYLASIDSRAAGYELMPGYDVATWLNAHVQPGQRVALGGWSGYSYFVSPDHLLNSESAEEYQWLWERYRSLSPSFWTADYWHFYATNDFTYVIVAKELVDNAVWAWPDDTARARPQVAFVGYKDAVLRIEQQEKH